MGQPQARKSRKHTNGNHPLHRTRNYGRDIDQIHGDLNDKKKAILQNTTVDEDKPGLGLWYCVECARWFVDENTLTKHKTSKVHKRRYPSSLDLIS
jgi:bud site selection protein 20